MAPADATLDARAFDMLPAVPTGLRKRGTWVTVRSTVAGVISAVDGEKLAKIRALPSYHSEYLPPTLSPGNPIIRTTDACSVHGCFNLVNADASALERDYETAQAIIDSGLFTVHPEASSPHSPAHSIEAMDMEDIHAAKRQALDSPVFMRMEEAMRMAPPRPESLETM